MLLRFKHLIFIFIAISANNATQFKVTKQIYFDVRHGTKDLGKISIGLFGEIAPKTVKNFMQLATTGVKGKSYVGTTFHRVIQKFMIQGGDVLFSNGTGSISIYGKHFKDETFEVKHTDAGFISMANTGKNTNGCQFFITAIAAPWLDDHHTIFGKVVEGQDVVHKIELIKTDSDDRPTKPVVIVKSGVIPTPEPFYVSDERYDLWAWIRASALPLGMSFSILGFFHWVMMKLPS